jgi:hypothetical protein
MDCETNGHYVGAVSLGTGEVGMKFWLIGITAALSLMAMAPDHGGAAQQPVVSAGAR